MDWEENYRPGRSNEDGYAGDTRDNRPSTPEEIRTRNARRDKPLLDAQAQKTPEQPRRQSGQRKNAAEQQKSDDGQRPGKNKQDKKTAGSQTAKAGKRAKPRRTRRVAPSPETEIHWSQPKPFIRKVFALKLAATLAVVLAVVLGFSVFFKVERVFVSGTEKYTPETIFEASGIEKGESLLSLNQPQKAGNIMTALPYVKNVQIGIKLPDTVNISIEEFEVTYAIEDTEGRWWLIGSNGKLVEGISETEAAEHAVIIGLLIQNPQVGEMIEAMTEQLPTEAAPDGTDGAAETQPEETDAQTNPETEAAETGPIVTSPDSITGAAVSKAEALIEILQALEANNLMGEIRKIDITYLYNITLWYQDRLEVRLGEPVELSYKVDYMAAAIGQLADYQIGVLDVTFANETEARFIPEQTSEEEEN